MSGKRRKTFPVHRVYLSLDEPDYDLLQAYAAELGKPEATVAGRIVIEALRGARNEAGRVSQERIEAQLRVLRGEPANAVKAPRWEWPISVLLSDLPWWDRWLPQLYRLLGRRLGEQQRGRLGERPGAVLNREGYANVLEFLFPTVTGPRGAISWRSPDYPAIAEKGRQGEDGRPLAPAWEAVIRHVVVALCAIEDTTAAGVSASSRILVEDQIRHGWAETLKYLVGEGQPALPQKPLA